MALWIPAMFVIGIVILIVALVIYGALYPSIVEQRLRVRATYIFAMFFIILAMIFFIINAVGVIFFS